MGSNERPSPTVQESVRTPWPGKKFLTWYGNEFFTLVGNEFFTSFGKQFFTSHGKQKFTWQVIADRCGEAASGR